MIPFFFFVSLLTEYRLFEVTWMMDVWFSATYSMPAVCRFWFQPETFVSQFSSHSVSSCRRIVCRPPIDKWRARMTNATHHRNPSPRKQIISRYIASADLVSVTAPGRRVWPVPLPARGAAGPPCHACQATVSRQQTQGPPVILDQWTHLHTHLSTVLSHGETRGKKRKRKKKKSEAERAHPGWLMTWFWMNGWVWIAWFREMWLRLTDLREARVWLQTLQR